MSRLLPQEDVPMNAEELEKFKQLLAAYDQALRLQRMRERTIETYRQYLGPAEEPTSIARQLIPASISC